MPFLETGHRTYHMDGVLPSAAWVWVFGTSHTRNNDTSQSHAGVQFFGSSRGSVGLSRCFSGRRISSSSRL